MKMPTHYATHCPECNALVKLPLVVREVGTDHAMPGNMRADVSVDPSPMQDHMRNVHRVGITQEKEEQ